MNSFEITRITEILKDWHTNLSERASFKTSLRKANSLIEVEKLIFDSEYFIKLKEEGVNSLSSAALLGLAAQVDKNNPEVNFICALGNKLAKKRKPAYCEVHFERLTSHQSLITFYNRLKRAILVLEREVDLTSLTECIIHWEEKELEDKLKGNLNQDYIKKIREEWERNFTIFGTS